MLKWIGSLTRFLPSFLPGVGALFNPWVLGAMAIALAGAWFYGYTVGRDRLDDYIAKQAVESVKLVAKRSKVSTRVVTRYVQVAGKTELVIKEVEKEVVKYAQLNPGLCLDDRWRVLHDAAASGSVPDAPGGTPDRVRTPAAFAGREANANGSASTANDYLKLRASPSLRR